MYNPHANLLGACTHLLAHKCVQAPDTKTKTKTKLQASCELQNLRTRAYCDI